MAEIHNLDLDVQEYFEFIVKGHTYRFRHLTMDEIEQMRKMSGEDLEKFFYQFITKKDEASPEFSEVAKTMITPQWVNFRKMVLTEFGQQ